MATREPSVTRTATAVSFSLGATVLGEALAGPRLTPFDLAGVTEEAVGGCEVDEALLPEDDFRIVHNLAVLLQTLDTDGDPTAGIEISAEVAALFNEVTVDMDQSWEAFQADTGLQSVLTEADLTLRTRKEALEALYQGIGVVHRRRHRRHRRDGRQQAAKVWRGRSWRSWRRVIVATSKTENRRWYLLAPVSFRLIAGRPCLRDSAPPPPEAEVVGKRVTVAHLKVPAVATRRVPSGRESACRELAKTLRAKLPKVSAVGVSPTSALPSVVSAPILPVGKTFSRTCFLLSFVSGNSGSGFL